MSLIKTIQADYLAARYAKDTLKSNLLSTLLGEAQAVGKDAGNRDATDAEVVAMIKKFIKNANQVAETARDNHAAMTNAYKEIAILDAYLPQQLMPTVIEDIITERIEAGDNLGAIMFHFKTNYAGQYDGKIVSGTASAKLA